MSGQTAMYSNYLRILRKHKQKGAVILYWHYIDRRAKSNRNTRILELIDGQQRTTTLVLIALAFRKAGIKTPLSNIAVLGKQPRLQFTIRYQVQNLLGGLAGLEQYQLPSANDIKNDPYLTHLDALSVLIKKVDALKLPSK
jgi:hypothetical protein